MSKTNILERGISELLLLQEDTKFSKLRDLLESGLEVWISHGGICINRKDQQITL